MLILKAAEPGMRSRSRDYSHIPLRLHIRTTSAMPSFQIRAATLAAGDDKRLVAFIDSQLPWLASQGSHDQWGEQEGAKDAEVLERYRETVRRSESSTDQSLGSNWCQASIAEADVPAGDLSAEQTCFMREAVDGESCGVPVGGMILEGKPAPYVSSQLLAQDDKAPFIYMKTLVSDRRLPSFSKGVGAALIAHARTVAAQLGVRRICCDCWRGNYRKLVNYYQRLGFEVLGDFEDEEDGWIGTVLEMRL